MKIQTTLPVDQFNRLNYMLDAQLEQLSLQLQPTSNPQNANSYSGRKPLQSFIFYEDKVKNEMDDLQTKISKLEHQFNQFSAQDITTSKENSKVKRNQFMENIQLTEDEEINLSHHIKSKFQKKQRSQLPILKDYDGYQEQLNQSGKKRAALQNSIQQAENQLNHSCYSISQDSHSQRGSTRKEVALKQTRRNSFGFVGHGHVITKKKGLYEKQDSILIKQQIEEQIEEQNKIRELQNKISRMKRERNKVQEEMCAVKAENKAIKEQIDKSNKLLTRIKQNEQTNVKMEEEFNKLTAFFEKSESIRKQQKILIINLKEELEGLKGKAQKTGLNKTVKKATVGKKKKKSK